MFNMQDFGMPEEAAVTPTGNRHVFVCVYGV